MKKLIAIAFMGALVVTSCAKKETAIESNTMLPEPEATVSDTVASDSATAATSTVTTPAVTDSTMTK